MELASTLTFGTASNDVNTPVYKLLRTTDVNNNVPKTIRNGFLLLLR